MSNQNQPQDPTSELDPVTRQRQRDCTRHVDGRGNIKTPGMPLQCAFCGMTAAAQEQYAAEQLAWANWQAAAQTAFGAGKSYNKP